MNLMHISGTEVTPQASSRKFIASWQMVKNVRKSLYLLQEELLLAEHLVNLPS